MVKISLIKMLKIVCNSIKMFPVIIFLILTNCIATYQGATVVHEEGNNQKPEFLNCGDYAPVIQEEQPQGIFVVQVQATCPNNATNNTTNNIVYSLVLNTPERPKFNVDAQTGVVTTAYVFDRDEPAHEKEAYIMVRATVAGRQLLDSVCAFKVTIKDINDNAPFFNRIKYNEMIAVDALVRSPRW